MRVVQKIPRVFEIDRIKSNDTDIQFDRLHVILFSDTNRIKTFTGTHSNIVCAFVFLQIFSLFIFLLIDR